MFYKHRITANESPGVGVAYSWNSRPLKIVQKWPGGSNRLPTARDDKVPTTLIYKDEDTQGGGDLEQWGFGCSHRRPRVEWFKRYLDPKVLNQFQFEVPTEAYTSEAIKRFYVDFLTNLYNHLKYLIRAQNGDWRKAKVEFLFSVPSTFISPAISNKFREYIELAGFGKGGLSHTVEISLTEPQAAAVYTVTESARGFKPNDILLVVDAGGGTTDTCILEMAGTSAQPNFNELLPVHGINVGSTNIDEDFQKLVKDKLRRNGMDISDNPDWDMVNSTEYEVQKCNFGQPGSQTPFLSVRVPSLPSNFSNDSFGIIDGRMLFTKQVIHRPILDTSY
jgi:hypothetical protein